MKTSKRKLRSVMQPSYVVFGLLPKAFGEAEASPPRRERIIKVMVIYV